MMLEDSIDLACLFEWHTRRKQKKQCVNRHTRFLGSALKFISYSNALYYGGYLGGQQGS